MSDSASSKPPISSEQTPSPSSDTASSQPRVPEWTAPDATFGPNVFNRTREQWLRGDLRGFGTGGGRSAAAATKRSDPSGDALMKLDQVLNTPGVDEDVHVWKHYLQDVHGRLVGGNKVKKGLRLSQAVCLALFVSSDLLIAGNNFGRVTQN